MYQCYDVTTFDIKNKRAQYRKSNRGEKDKRVREVEKMERVREEKKAIGEIR